MTRTQRITRSWRSIGAVAAMLAAGALAGRIAAADPERSTTRAISAGAATLAVPGDWHAAATAFPRGTVASLATGDRDTARVLIAFGPADDASLVPPGLRHGVRDLRRDPRPAQLAGYRAWSYTGHGSGETQQAVRVTVLPTGSGVVGVACVAASSRATDRCAAEVRSVSIGRGPILEPAPDTALRLRAPAVLAVLDSIRVRAHLGFRDSRTAKTQIALSRELAQAHQTARDSLRPFAGPGSFPLDRALAEAARAYAALARAAGESPPMRFVTARADAAAADAAVAGAVSRLAEAGPLAAQRAATVTAPPTTGVPLRSMLLALSIALLVAFLPAATRRVLGRRVRDLPAREALAPAASQPCILAPIRRRPIAPPPTFGRWYEPPRTSPRDSDRTTALRGA